MPGIGLDAGTVCKLKYLPVFKEQVQRKSSKGQVTVQASPAVTEVSAECSEKSETERIPDLAKGVPGYVCVCVRTWGLLRAQWLNRIY